MMVNIQGYEMNMKTQEGVSTVSEMTKQETDTHNLGIQIALLKRWVKAKAWTDRMLVALVNGVKGNKWFSLFDKIANKDTLKHAWELVKRNRGAAGVDRVTIERFEKHWAKYLREILDQLEAGTYQPLAIRRVYIPKGYNTKDLRPLGIPAVKDRIVQAALKMILEPIFEHEFIDTSYGFRPGKGCKDALREVDKHLRKGYTWYVDADLKSYFDTIPHEPMMERMKERIADGRVLEIIKKYLKQSIIEDCKEWNPIVGSPQGAVLSPLLANIYLHPLDRLMKEANFKMVRYADDFVILCESQEGALKALEMVKEWVQANGLILHPEKTRIGNCVNVGDGFDFLGYRFEAGLRQVRKKSLDKMKDKIRNLTKRSNGQSLVKIIQDLNSISRGWFEYFKHAHVWTFERLDGFIRRRLRAVLRKREKRPGMGRTKEDHTKWTNKFFAKLGFFSMKDAWVLAVDNRPR
jgi:RNA-directed DNA polymerase